MDGKKAVTGSSPRVSFSNVFEQISGGLKQSVQRAGGTLDEKKKQYMPRDVLSFAHRARRARPERGVVLLLDPSINEALVVAKDDRRQTAAVHPRDMSESLQRVVRAKDDAMWIECEVTNGVVTQFVLVADEDRVDARLASGDDWGVEQDVVHLCRTVWVESRIPIPWDEATAPEPSDKRVDEDGRVVVGPWRAEIPLLEHQTKTVEWMRDLERGFPMPLSYDGNLRVTSSWFVDTENECFTRAPSTREAELMGGICAEGTGRGKTASVLRLVSDTLNEPLVASTDGANESRATLIVLPLNLVGQWKSEIHKFLDVDALRVYYVVQGRDLPTMQQALDADLVVTTFHFLRNNRVYADMVDRCLGQRPRERYSLAAWARVPNRTECVLEAILWRRVVIDEIHQTFERVGDVKHMRLLRTRALWGLSATPCLHNDQAQQLYSLLAREKAHHPNLLASLVARCVRRGTVGDLGAQERRSVRRVSLSAEERILLAGGAGETLAEKVRRVTFVDVDADGADVERGDGVVSQVSLQRRRDRDALRMRLQGHERNVRILEGVGHDLRENLARVEAAGDSEETRTAARLACETHEEDLAVAKRIHRRELLRLSHMEAVDDEIQQRVRRVADEVVCAACGARELRLHMLSSCLHMLCAACLGVNSVCAACGDVVRDAFPVETTRGVGSKMREIAALVRSIHAPCILFVQWKSMVRGTRAFLKGMGMRVHTLDGNLTQRQNALLALQDEGVGVLLLCLEDGFAGLHLPHVAHVIFAHAIVGDRDRVVTLESQAVARCLRYGQTRDVQTYSFVVENTEECALYDRTHDDVGAP